MCQRGVIPIHFQILLTGMCMRVHGLCSEMYQGPICADLPDIADDLPENDSAETMCDEEGQN